MLFRSIGDRASFCQSRLRDGELKSGEDYSSIPNIISIWICEDSVTQRKGCCHEIVSMYKENSIDPIEIASEKMRQFIIELKKLNRTPQKYLSQEFKVWMKFILNPGKIDDEALKIPEIKEAQEELMKMSADAETRAEYEARMRMQNDIIAGQTIKFNQGMELGRKQGEEIGRRQGEEIGRKQGEEIGRKQGEEIGEARGLAKGRHDNALETARNLLSMKLSIDQVVRATGLSLTEVEDLVK